MTEREEEEWGMVVNWNAPPRISHVIDQPGAEYKRITPSLEDLLYDVFYRDTARGMF